MAVKRVLHVVSLAFLAIPVVAQHPTIYDRMQSEGRVSYTIQAVLDEVAHTVHGNQRITWRNPDKVEVETLEFHLYLNAFLNERSTFMQESGGVHRGQSLRKSDGGITINRLASQRSDLTDHITFIQPDDGNADDRTVARVVLPEPVGPGETIELDMHFTARLPEVTARTGWKIRDDGTPFFMVAQWFPKLGVYEVPGQRFVPSDAPRGRWNTHQFHANGEFYADFAAYNVTIDVPKDFVVGATGVRISEHVDAGRQILVYHALDVHDFAWTASPAFLEFTDNWRHVTLRLLLQPEHRGQAQRHFEAAKIALEKTDELLGVYPYTSLTLVDGLGGANGMEYPTLITLGTTYGLPTWLRPLELVTVHEFTHQYFYGLLASHEAEEAWLDEGMTSYVETRIVDEVWGPGSVLDLFGLRIDDGPGQRVMYERFSPRGALVTRSWEYPSTSDYVAVSYMKASTVLHTLEGYFGEDAMRRFLRTYVETWRFRHPTTRSVQEAAETASGKDLAWFFDQYVYGEATVDYSVDTLYVMPDPDGGFRSTVRLSRLHSGTFPQVIEVRFEDGFVQRVEWNGIAAQRTLTFDHSAPAVDAHIDPDNLIWLDVNRLNNRQALSDSGVFARRTLVKVSAWLQQVLFAAAALF